ncbi:MAG TPA: c-type cytochrome [Steroidobacteraceae bacterium]
MRLSLTARLTMGVLCCLGASAVPAASGQQLFVQCVACHGAQAAGNPAVGAPAIAGQQLAYLQRQLQNFRAGIRGTHPADTQGAQMRAIAQTLPNDAALASVAAYVASLPQTTVKPAAGADLKNGNNLYQGKCGACHGTRAEGNVALATPRLAGLDALYLRRQFQHFAQGQRGAHPKDTYGRQMAMMSKTLPTPKDLDDVIAYVQAQGGVR